MNKTEFEDIEYYIKEVETSDEGNEALERLYSHVKSIYKEYCNKHGIKPII